MRKIHEAGCEDWSPLFTPSDFWVRHSKFLAAEVFVFGAPPHMDEELLRSWSGFVESRLRR